MDNLNVHIGGSNRQLERTVKAFADAGIPLDVVGYVGHGHFSNQTALIPNTIQAKDLLHKMKGTVAREQWANSDQRKFPGL